MPRDLDHLDRPRDDEPVTTVLTAPTPPEGRAGLAGLHALGRSEWLQAGAITAAAFVVILVIAPRGLWLDETISVRRSGLPLTTLTTFSLGGEPNMALFHYLLWPLGQLHASDLVFRLVPITAGAATLGGVYLLGLRLFDRTTAVIAVAVLAAHGLLTRYATEVRGYSLIMLLMVASALFLSDAVSTDRRRSWVLFALCCVASFGLHFVGVLFAGAQIVALLPVRRALNPRHAIPAIVAVGTGVVGLGLLWVMSDQDYWVAWLPSVSDDVVRDVGEALLGGTPVAALVVGAFVLLGSVLAARALWRSPATAWSESLVLSMMWIPIAGGAVASAAHALAYPRYFLAILPPLAILAARGVQGLPGRQVVTIAAAVALVASVAVGHDDLDRQRREGMDDATAYVVANARSGDGVFLPYNEELSGFTWYADGRLPDGVVEARPGVPADAIRSDWWWQKASRLGPDMPAFASGTQEQWSQQLASIDRVWVVSGFIAHDPRFHDTGSDYVPQGRVECDRQFFRGIDVVLWARSCD